MRVFDDLPPVFDTKALADALATTPRHVVDMRSNKTGPAWIRVGRKVRYVRQSVQEWAAANSHAHN